jgi:Holliday junction resolvase RusA-like endonuclease
LGKDRQTIPGPPNQAPNSVVLFYAHFEVEKHYSKKNSKTIGWRRGSKSTPFIMSTKAAKSTERDILLQLMQNRVFDLHTKFPIESMAMSGVFVVESATALTKKGTINLRDGDLDNIVSSYLDLLMKADVISDDALVTSITAFKRPSDSNKITIWLLGE